MGVGCVGPLCPADISPASGGNPTASVPGVPRSHRFACSRPFRFAKGALGGLPVPQFVGEGEGLG